MNTLPCASLREVVAFASVPGGVYSLPPLGKSEGVNRARETEIDGGRRRCAMAATAPAGGQPDAPAGASTTTTGTATKPADPPAPPGKPGTFQIAKPGGVCAVSGRPIAPGEKFMAAVRETPTGLERVDVAAEHWEAFHAQQGNETNDLLGFWQTVMPRPEQKKKVFVDDEVLCTLFERLAGATEPTKGGSRLVLGLLLMRKRQIAYDSTRHDPPPEGSPAGTPGRDVWVVRMKGRTDMLDLVDPKLGEKQVIEVSQQLGEI